MDRSSISTLIWTAAILLYGIYEYRRRERRHRIDMEYIRRRIEPPAESELLVPRWRIATVALTAFILTGGAVFLVYTGTRFPYAMTPMIVAACIFLALAVPLIFMIVRDSRLPRGRLRRSP